MIKESAEVNFPRKIGYDKILKGVSVVLSSPWFLPATNLFYQINLKQSEILNAGSTLKK